MSTVEHHGGPITHRYLMNKSKDDLARMYLELLENRWRFAKAAFVAGRTCLTVQDHDTAFEMFENGTLLCPAP